MSDRKIILGTTLKAIADAIRNKLGTSKLYKPSEMAEAIESISTGTDVSDTSATADDVVLGKIFHLADGSQASGLLAENEIFANWSGKDLNHGVTEGYSRGSKTAITSLTELTPSNTSPASITSGGRYYAKSSGYAISSYSSTNKVPSESGTLFTKGWNYMTLDGYCYNRKPNSGKQCIFGEVTVSNSTTVTINCGFQPNIIFFFLNPYCAKVSASPNQFYNGICTFYKSDVGEHSWRKGYNATNSQHSGTSTSNTSSYIGITSDGFTYTTGSAFTNYGGGKAIYLAVKY
ncbi:MAG: hypothetical protein KBT06_05125 [Prevotellaceae bacterium]|nr:hypothetical protein [Candidatus Colivivens equi]